MPLNLAAIALVPVDPVPRVLGQLVISQDSTAVRELQQELEAGRGLQRIEEVPLHERIVENTRRKQGKY
jgi:hypothetical protein